MDTLTIIVRPFSEGGYYYDIYDHEHGADCEDPDECESEDGGWCTSTLANAIDMASGAAADLDHRKREGRNECPICNESIPGKIAYSKYDEDTPVCPECREREEEEGDILSDR
jgi:hypothetical protein